MTRYLSIMTIGAALSMTAGMAAAGDTVSADTILNALKPKPGVSRSCWMISAPGIAGP